MEDINEEEKQWLIRIMRESDLLKNTISQREGNERSMNKNFSIQICTG